jgi:uncharacterized protein YbjQ (UPF0145 family)
VKRARRLAQLILRPAAVIAPLVLLSACGGSSVYRLTDEDFTQVKSPDEVRLFTGELTRPYLEIALINSEASEDRTVANRREQLRQLQREAARLGADAVADVRVLEERHKGMVADPTVPLPAWKQGDTTLYFLRGTAVRWLDPEVDPVLEFEEEAAGLTLEQVTPAPDRGTPATMDIPEQTTADPEEGQEPFVRPGY